MSLHALHTELQQARGRYETAAERFHRAVRDALADGDSPTRIAVELGVSRGRVYQWRDKAR